VFLHRSFCRTFTMKFHKPHLARNNNNIKRKRHDLRRR
jgi:hypothetical protein